MTTVVKFPTNRIVREVLPNIEEIEKAKEKSIQRHADTIVEDLFLSLLDAIDNYGIETETLDFEKDYAFVVDSIRAAVYRSFNIEHPLHKFIDTNVKVVHAESKEDLMAKIKELLEKQKLDMEEVIDIPNDSD